MSIPNRQLGFLGVLPAEWSSDRTKDVVRLRNGKVSINSSEQNYLELEDIEGSTGCILSRQDTLSVESAVTKFRSGDVLFGKLRPYLAKYCQPDFDGYCTGEILAFEPRRIFGRFLFYCIASDWFIEQCNTLAYGAKMPRVNWPTQIGTFELPLPPRAEQERIAVYLDSSCAAIDDAIKAKKKQVETLAALRNSVIQKAVTQGLDTAVVMRRSGVDWLGLIPRHWKAQKLKRLFKNVDYGISSSTEQAGQFPVLKMGNIVEGEVVFANMGFVDEVDPHLFVEHNDLLFNRTNSLDQVAKVAIFRGQGSAKVTFASYLVRLRLNQKNDPSYLNYLVNTDAFLRLARKMAIPSVQQANLNPTRYCQLEVPVPPLTEQIDIGKFLDEKTAQIRQSKEKLASQIATLTAYRGSLIHECVTGKRRISEAGIPEVGAYV